MFRKGIKIKIAIEKVVNDYNMKWYIPNNTEIKADLDELVKWRALKITDITVTS